MLSELRVPWFKKVSQTLLYLPHFMSWMIIGGMAYQLFATQSGVINHLLTSITGGEPVAFLTTSGWWVGIYIGSGIWQSMGWSAIIFLAAIAGINPDLYEAATVDGCGRLRRIWHITLPGIRPTISIILILQLGKFMDIGFERPYALGNVLVRDVGDVISTFVYRVGILSAQFSVATAVGLFQSLIGLVLLVTANQLSKRIGDQGIW
jgi:putative aldouronate transport system permease protein